MVEQSKFSKQQIELLESLGNDYNVYVILDRFNIVEPEIYICDEFREAVNNIHFHSLRIYKRITDVISANSTYVNNVNSLGAITTKIDGMDMVVRERKYEESFYWIKF